MLEVETKGALLRKPCSCSDPGSRGAPFTGPRQTKRRLSDAEATRTRDLFLPHGSSRSLTLPREIEHAPLPRETPEPLAEYHLCPMNGQLGESFRSCIR
jgi:hypothetical protein